MVATGSLLILVPRIMRVLGVQVHFITLPAPQPTVEQNSLALLLQLHGAAYGYLLFCIGLLGLIWDHLPRRQAGDQS
ncbi:hypothetical protein [Leeia aquatica]|uniref:Uncharacterized protein n=1 Tax=Leeia aquatica TaxID=2725557 RepID=A0A847SE78_9NEIS|nr:hypothetical protein [Leeia aquatica]NLR74252.1 hypothetical protein [Leeia aquatica]